MLNTISNDKYICCECGVELPSSKFFKSLSSLFAGIGHLPICKDCLEREYKKYKIAYHGDMNRAMQRICMMFDIYYDTTLFNSCDGNDEKAVGNYIRKTNLGQYKKRTFDTSVEEGFIFIDGDALDPDERPSIENPPNPKYVNKWGGGLSNIDYEELEKHYKYLKSANPNCDSNQEIFIVELCYTKMQQMKAVREGRVDDYKKLADSYRQSFSQAGLKTIRDNNLTESFTIGVNAEKIEHTTPAEYYKDQSLFKDFDGLGEYFKRMITRPIKNIIFGSDERDTEYYVKDEGDSDEYQEE